MMPITRWRDLDAGGCGVAVLHGRHERDLPVHAHDFWELQVGERGSAVHRTADGQQVFQRGSIALIRPGTWHRKDACRGLVSWACCWPPGHSAHALAAADARIGPLLVGPATCFRDLDESLTRRCLAALSALRTCTALAASGHLLLLLDVLAGAAAARRDQAPPAVLRMLAAFEAEPQRTWSMAGAARAVGLSPTHAARGCRAVTGYGPLAYLTRLRLDRADALLLDGQAVAAVASACGFPDPAYFARCFRRHRGCAPGERRARLLQLG